MENEQIDLSQLGNILAQGVTPIDTTSSLIEDEKVQIEKEVKADDLAKDTPPVVETKVETPTVETQVEEDATVAFQVFEKLQESLGLEFTPEELENVELDDSLDSVTKIAELAGNKIGNQMFTDFFKTNPDIYEAFQHKQAYGSLKDFNKEAEETQDYTSIDLSVEDNQKLVYAKSLAIKGNDEETIKDLIELALDKGILDKKAELAKPELIKYNEDIKAQRDLEISQKIKEKEDLDRKYVEDTYKTIDSGKLLGVTLSPKEKNEMKDYLSVPVDKEGNTARDIAWSKLTIEQELFIERLVKNGFKDVFPVASKSVKSLKELQELNKNRSNGVGGTKSEVEVNISNEIDMEAILKMTKRA